MPRDARLLIERNHRIKTRYYEIINAGKKNRRRRVYADEVLAILEKEFYLSPRTLMNIIYEKI